MSTATPPGFDAVPLFVAGFIPARETGRELVRPRTASAATCLLLGEGDLSATRAGASLLAGAVFAPIFPTTIGVVFQHFEEAQRGTLFGVIFAIGLIGASTIPAWIGSLAKGKSVASGLNILRVTAIALAIIAALLGAAPLF